MTSLGVELVELAEWTGRQLELVRPEGQELQNRLKEGLRQVRSSAGAGAVATVVEVAPWSRIPEQRALFVPQRRNEPRPALVDAGFDGVPRQVDRQAWRSCARSGAWSIAGGRGARPSPLLRHGARGRPLRRRLLRRGGPRLVHSERLRRSVKPVSGAWKLSSEIGARSPAILKPCTAPGGAATYVPGPPVPLTNSTSPSRTKNEST